ncbi:MAG: hypothetical protein DCF16_13650 [Alphaproteobacteria bacterium]|nr:MAG: hypothetical protein DCF16_13650 [Alphaproteobacteria bacterium]
MRRHTAPLLASAFGLIGAALTPALASSGAAYATLPLRDAAACARACADDGLCIAWIQRIHGGCELAATAPTTWPADGSAVGLSSRAPAFATLPVSTPSAAPPAMNVNTELEIIADITEDDDPAYALLGGPDEDGLSLRIGRSQ